MTISVAVLGSAGRMGSEVVRAVHDAPDLELAGAFDVGFSPADLADTGAAGGGWRRAEMKRSHLPRAAACAGLLLAPPLWAGEAELRASLDIRQSAVAIHHSPPGGTS